MARVKRREAGEGPIERWQLGDFPADERRAKAGDRDVNTDKRRAKAGDRDANTVYYQAKDGGEPVIGPRGFPDSRV